MEREESVRREVGCADGYELLSCAFAYPDERLAKGLVDGSVASDALACLLDAGAGEVAAREAAERLGAWRSASASELLSSMRVLYSRLYLKPGGHTPVQPYESAFLHAERGLPGVPALFRTSVTMDVERQMREAGVVAKDARKEPCDSVFQEFEFLSYVHAKLAEALGGEDEAGVALWSERLRVFEEEHTRVWLPLFLRRTQELAADEPYAAFAAFGLCLMGVQS